MARLCSFGTAATATFFITAVPSQAALHNDHVLQQAITSAFASGSHTALHVDAVAVQAATHAEPGHHQKRSPKPPKRKPVASSNGALKVPRPPRVSEEQLEPWTVPPPSRGPRASRGGTSGWPARGADAGQRRLTQKVLLLKRLRDIHAGPKETADVVAALCREEYLETPEEYTSVFADLTKNGAWSAAVMVFDNLMCRPGLEISIILPNAAANACGRHGLWTEALSLITAARSMKARPDVVTFSTAVAACQQGKSWRTAAELLGVTCQRAVRPNEFVLGATVGAFSKGSRWQASIHAYADAAQRGIKTGVIPFNSVVGALSKGSRWPKAVDIFEEHRLPRSFSTSLSFELSAATFTMAIAAFGRGSQWRGAVALLEEGLGSYMLLGNVAAYGAALGACAEGGAWEWALQLLSDAIEDGITPNKVLYSSAMSACRRSGRWSWALQLWADMLSRRIAPDNIAYGVLTSVFDKAKSWQAAWSALEEMQRRRGLEPSAVIYGSVIGSCERGRKWELSLHLFEEMAYLHLGNGDSRGSLATSHREVALGSTIAVCSKGRKWRWALEMHRHCKHDRGGDSHSSRSSKPHVASEESWGAVMNACRHADEWRLAADVLDVMLCAAVQPSSPTVHTSAIVAFERGRQWELSISVLPAMVERHKLQLDDGAFRAVFAACERAGQWQQAAVLAALGFGVDTDSRSHGSRTVPPLRPDGGSPSLVTPSVLQAVHSSGHHTAAHSAADVKARRRSMSTGAAFVKSAPRFKTALA